MEREKSKADSRAACRGEPAQDNRIIELYWQRDEEAIRQTEKRYGRYLLTIACNILSNREDGRETVNDTYLKAWNSMPPHRPSHLSSFLAKITRDLSIDRLAGEFYLSRYYLMHRFKEVYGITAHQYIRQKRLLRAAEEIRRGTPVLKAAMEAGFNDYSAFLRAFQAAYGMSPRAWK